MTTMAAQNEALKFDVNASLALLREDMAKRDTEAARREVRSADRRAGRVLPLQAPAPARNPEAVGRHEVPLQRRRCRQGHAELEGKGERLKTSQV